MIGKARIVLGRVPRGLCLIALFAISFGATYATAVAANERSATECFGKYVGYPPGLGQHVEVDTINGVANLTNHYVNRDYTALQYWSGILWWSENEPAGTHKNNVYYDTVHANYSPAQAGVYNRTYGTATGWLAELEYSC